LAEEGGERELAMARLEPKAFRSRCLCIRKDIPRMSLVMFTTAYQSVELQAERIMNVT
jgi:hypothetical protein